MKKLIYLSVIIFALSSCGKDGEMGPQGEIGPKGEQGEAGPQGIPGKDGSRILSGVSAPDISMGSKGDFFLNLRNGDLFGPKTDDGWGSPFNMKGSKGDDGKDGSNGNDGADGKDGSDGQDGKDGSDGATILSGGITPTISQGKLGDFYIDTSDYTIYGPKNLDYGWGDPVSLKTNEENNVISYSIIPKFDKIIYEGDNSYFEVETKSYYIPDIGSRYVSLSYYFNPNRMDDPRENISFYTYPLHPTNNLPEIIRLGLESSITNGVLEVSMSNIDHRGGANITFKLKGNIYGFGEGLILTIPNFAIKALLYNMNDNGLISKKNTIERFLRIPL